VVHFRGDAPSYAELLAGRVDATLTAITTALPHIQAGKLRAIAVGSPQRVPFLPDVKTVAEQGFPGFSAVSWGGLLAPAGTPAAVVKTLNDALKQALADPMVQDKLKTAGTFAAWQSPADTAARIRSDDQQWGTLIKEKGIAGS
jgi:tripartite-type tricarboxylate transporter receptor subunit TctC